MVCIYVCAYSTVVANNYMSSADILIAQNVFSHCKHGTNMGDP